MLAARIEFRALSPKAFDDAHIGGFVWVLGVTDSIEELRSRAEALLSEMDLAVIDLRDEYEFDPAASDLDELWLSMLDDAVSHPTSVAYSNFETFPLDMD